MREPVWLTRSIVDHIHFDQIQQHGGSHGIRSEYALESALSRPEAKWTYEENPDLALLAAAYGFGLVKAHAFVDGNKRVAFMTMYTFLGLNGYDLETPEAEAVEVMLDLVDGAISEKDLTAWIRARMMPRGDKESSDSTLV